jgi:hypothetical protein
VEASDADDLPDPAEPGTLLAGPVNTADAATNSSGSIATFAALRDDRPVELMTSSAAEVRMAGRTVAIGDIHGCPDALAALMDAVAPGRDDTVVLLGDYIDRGPNSRGGSAPSASPGRQDQPNKPLQ